MSFYPCPRHKVGIAGICPRFPELWSSSSIYKDGTICYGKVIWHPRIGLRCGLGSVGYPARSLLSSLPSQAEFHASLGYPLRGWNFTPPFPRHGRATNTRGGGWRRGSRRARTVASGARRRRLWSLRATTNSGSRPSCGGLRLDKQPRLDEQILTLAGDACALTVQASRVCGSNGFCFIGFWAVGVTDLPDGAVPLRADRPSACPNARPRAALRRRRPKCGADRGASRLVSTGGTTTSLHSQVVCLRRKSWKCGVIVSG